MDAHGEIPYGEILTALANVTARYAGHLFRAELDEAEEGNVKREET